MASVDKLGIETVLTINKTIFKADKREVLREWNEMFTRMIRVENVFNRSRERLQSRRLQSLSAYHRRELLLAKNQAERLARIGMTGNAFGVASGFFGVGGSGGGSRFPSGATGNASKGSLTDLKNKRKFLQDIRNEVDPTTKRFRALTLSIKNVNDQLDMLEGKERKPRTPRTPRTPGGRPSARPGNSRDRSGRGSVALARNAFGLGQFTVGALGIGATVGVGSLIAKEWIKAGESLSLYDRQLSLLLSKRGDLASKGLLSDAASKFAKNTEFTGQDVRSSQISLLAAGANTKEIPRFTQALGELASINKTSLEDVTRPIARLLSGDFGEAFERLRDFKISRQDLEKQGLKFGAGGAFQGTKEEAVEGTIKAITEKFGGSLAESLETIGGKFNRLTGTFLELNTSFFPFVEGPLKEAIDNFAMNLSDPAVVSAVEGFGKGMAGVFTELSKVGPDKIAAIFQTIGDVTVNTASALIDLLNNDAFLVLLNTVSTITKVGAGAAKFGKRTANRIIGEVSQGDLSSINPITGGFKLASDFGTFVGEESASDSATGMGRFRKSGESLIKSQIRQGLSKNEIINLAKKQFGGKGKDDATLEFLDKKFDLYAAQNERLIKQSAANTEANKNTAKNLTSRSNTKSVPVITENISRR